MTRQPNLLCLGWTVDLAGLGLNRATILLGLAAAIGASDRGHVYWAAVHPGTRPEFHRHTTAMQLLRADVDITTIAAWLGHADLRTTHQYVEIDLRMKNAAMVEPTTILGESIEPVELGLTR